MSGLSAGKNPGKDGLRFLLTGRGCHWLCDKNCAKEKSSGVSDGNAPVGSSSSFRSERNGIALADGSTFANTVIDRSLPAVCVQNRVENIFGVVKIRRCEVMAGDAVSEAAPDKALAYTAPVIEFREFDGLSM